MPYLTIDDYWTPKDPGSTMDYGVDLSPQIPEGDSISAVVWTFPAGIAKVDQGHSGRTASVNISGGTAGQTYFVGYVATTVQGRTVDGTMRLPVMERFS